MRQPRTQAKLGQVVVFPFETADPSAVPEQAFTYVDISSIDPDTKAITAPRMVLGAEAPSRARRRIRTGDVLVATTRPNLNAVALVPRELDGQVCSTGFAVLRTTASVLPEYVFAFVRSPGFVRSLSQTVKGALYPAVGDTDVLAQTIPLIDIDSQRRVARALEEELRAVRRGREALAAQFEHNHVLRHRAYVDAYGTVSPLNVGRGAHREDGWSWKPLSDLARLESGHTPSRSRPDWWDGDVAWIQLADIRSADGRVIDATVETTNQLGISNSAARVLPRDTIAMSRTASVGFVAKMGRPMATSQDFVNWVCGPDLDPDFLMHLLIRSRSYIRSLSAGAVHRTVYYPTVKALWVCVPSIRDQRRIATQLSARLDAVDRIEARISSQLLAIDALPAAILRKTFEGGLTPA